jgi:predicted permease
LKQGVSVEQANSQLDTVSQRLARQYPIENTGWGATAIPLRDFLVGDVRAALWTLLGAVAFVLLIACANTANLVLARTIARRKELAIRAALGASASQVVRPVLVETTLLALAGGALGLLFAGFGQKLVMGALASQMPRATEVSVDGQVLLFTFVASVLTGLAAGLIASWRLTRVDLNEALKQGLGRTDADSGGRRTRTILVVSEVALSLMLLVGAGLMIRTLWELAGVSPGFDPKNVITMTVPAPSGSEKAERWFYDRFLARVRALPGVSNAGATDTLPLQGGGSQQPIVIEGRPAEVFALQPNVDVRVVTPGYWDAMGIPIVAGRDFTAQETIPAPTRGAILISHALARKYWPGENPVGKRLRISFTPDVLREVVGVVGDVKERGLDVMNEVPMLYVPYLHDGDNELSLVVRSDREAARCAM